MNTFYISLCRGLSGYYIKVQAPSEDAVRNYATRYCGEIWCTIYTEGYFYEILRHRYPNATKVINNSKPVVINNLEGYFE